VTHQGKQDLQKSIPIKLNDWKLYLIVGCVWTAWHIPFWDSYKNPFSEIELLEKYGYDLREPYVKPIKGAKYKGLFELRIKFASDISRIFYFTYSQKTFVLLHGFTKKTEQTPERELERALRYKEDYERRCDDE